MPDPHGLVHRINSRVHRILFRLRISRLHRIIRGIREIRAPNVVENFRQDLIPITPRILCRKTLRGRTPRIPPRDRSPRQPFQIRHHRQVPWRKIRLPIVGVLSRKIKGQRIHSTLRSHRRTKGHQFVKSRPARLRDLHRPNRHPWLIKKVLLRGLTVRRQKEFRHLQHLPRGIPTTRRTQPRRQRPRHPRRPRTPHHRGIQKLVDGRVKPLPIRPHGICLRVPRTLPLLKLPLLRSRPLHAPFRRIITVKFTVVQIQIFRPSDPRNHLINLLNHLRPITPSDQQQLPAKNRRKTGRRRMPRISLKLFLRPNPLR